LREAIFSGMRPTGSLHVGHYLGVLENWKSLQENYNCFFGIVDWHALTTKWQDSADFKAYIEEMLAEWLSCGIDPKKSTIILQSLVPEHIYLHMVLSMLTPVSWLERNPTVKEQARELGIEDQLTYGHLGYPVLMAADILIYKSKKVPVGIDQVPHLEMTREIARRFNFHYKEIFPEPEALLAEFPKLLGVDGRKMSKSYNNAIYLKDDEKSINEKVASMITDPERIKKSDLGHPDVCNVFSYYGVLFKPELLAVRERCEKAQIGCVECKKQLAKKINDILEPIRSQRNFYLSNKGILWDILKSGSNNASNYCKNTMVEVFDAMKLNYPI